MRVPEIQEKVVFIENASVTARNCALLLLLSPKKTFCWEQNGMRSSYFVERMLRADPMKIFDEGSFLSVAEQNYDVRNDHMYDIG